MQRLIDFLKDESGNTTVQYCLISGTVAAAIAEPLQQVGQQLAQIFTIIASALASVH